jgi:hypothetical protein
MSIKKKSGRQDILLARVEFGFADVASATFNGAIELPHGARVVGGALEVLVATQATVVIDVGDTLVANRYKDNVDGTAVARTALIPTGYKTLLDADVGVTFSAAPSSGSFALEVQYVVEGRTAMTQGLDYRGPNVRGA